MFIFDEFDKKFQREFQSFFRMLQAAIFSEATDTQPNIEEHDRSRTIRRGPIIYGRVTTVGPDGRVQTQEWSNLSDEAKQKFVEYLREGQQPMFSPPQPKRPSPIPLPQPPNRPFPGPMPEPKLKDIDNYPIDVIDIKDGYVTIFDTPATSTDEIEVKVEGCRLNLWVRGQLFRELELPAPVEFESMQFRNGVVEVRLHTNKGNEEVEQKSNLEEQTQ